MPNGQISFRSGYIYVSGVSGLPRVLEEKEQTSVFLEPTLVQGQYRFPVSYPTMNAFAQVAESCLSPSAYFRFNRQYQHLIRRREKAAERYNALYPEHPEKLEGLFHLIPYRPYYYQQAGIERIQQEKRFFLGDTQGLGKTITALVSLYSMRAFPTLITCPANVKFNWPEEAIKWLPHIRVTCLTSSGIPSPPENNIPINDWKADILVVNYDILRNLEDRLIGFGFRGLIVDESHLIKNRDSERYQSLSKIAQGIETRICMSGTPVPNRPMELLPQLDILDRVRDFGGEKLFDETYCRIDQEAKVVDISSQKRLHEELKHSGFFMRRLKEEALPMLKPKELLVERIPITNQRDYKAAENDFVEWCKKEGINLNNALKGQGTKTGGGSNALLKMNHLKLVVSRGKMQSVKRWIWTFLERHPGEKLLVFLLRRETMETLRAEFDCLYINGDVPASERPALKRQFEDPAGPRVLFASLTAVNAGITLHANGLCRTVLTIELHWNGAVHEQAEDRVHRIGQSNSVSCITLLGENTIEEDIYKLIRAKTNQSARILSGKEAQGVSEVEEFSALDSLGGL